MGSVFGKISEETPHFESVAHIGDNKDIEIRRYDPLFVASVSSKDVPDATTQEEFTGVAFRTLAKESGPGEAIAMTAPVVLNSNENMAAEGGQPIAMTAPVVMGGTSSVDSTMSFILPSKFIKAGELPPIPLDPKVHITKLPSRLVAVKTFSGNLSKAAATAVATEALALLEKEPKYTVKLNEEGKPVWEYMGYNAPWTLPWCKTNEVAVILNE
ncbi:hypothetical protein LEN26_005419 [Aphanomyces euteiches]|nr:hypothetical protein AeMF1_000237 [Aphanomyces euteiches]KAH9138104.1 hypothetical protein LEN26_005419 [Aphanomyces euteiches]KAH9197350.1 hypothetical protein AeNC1_000695 [Aphanomyces euteiches]